MAGPKRQRLRRTRPPCSISAKVEASLRHEAFLPTSEAQEAAFHLVDWIDDLAELQEAFGAKRWSPADSQRALLRFIVHAPQHLAAAHRIIVGCPVTDVFEIGAVKGTGRAKRKPGAAWKHQQPMRQSRRRRT